MYNTHGILEKHTSFAVQNQAKKRHIRMDCTMLYLFYLSLYYFCSYWLQNRKKGRSYGAFRGALDFWNGKMGRMKG